MYADPAWRARRLALASADGQTVDVGEGLVTLRHRHVGDLIVTSGHIVACDPKWIYEYVQPFVTRVVPGRYPVVLGIVHFPDGSQCVAFATVRVQDRPPVRSEIARRPGDETFGEDYIPNYPVDSGKGCFMDLDAMHAWLQRLESDPEYDLVINEAMEATSVSAWAWASLSLEPDTAANLIAFTSGEGDGGYATYVGYDADGAVTCFTTDFALLGEDTEENSITAYSSS